MTSASRNKAKTDKESLHPKEFASDDIALRYLAKILVDAYLDYKEHEGVSNNKEKSGSVL